MHMLEPVSRPAFTQFTSTGLSEHSSSRPFFPKLYSCGSLTMHPGGPRLRLLIPPQDPRDLGRDPLGARRRVAQQPREGLALLRRADRRRFLPQGAAACSTRTTAPAAPASGGCAIPRSCRPRSAPGPRLVARDEGLLAHDRSSCLDPTGTQPLARKTTFQTPAVGFWNNFAGGWVIRDGLGAAIPTNASGDNLISFSRSYFFSANWSATRIVWQIWRTVSL